MGRKKRIGRLPKNFERKCQAASKKRVGRPSKHNNQLSNATNTLAVDEFVKMKSMKLPSLWNMSHCNDHHVIYKVQEQSSSTQPVVISHYLTIKSDLSWSLSIYGCTVTSQCSALAGLSDMIYSHELCNFLCKLDALTLCPGHPDVHFIRMAAAKGGSFFSPSGEITAYLDGNGIFKLNGKIYSETVRASKCHRLAQGAKCAECVSYRDRLRAIYHRWTKHELIPPCTSTHSHTNERWLTAAQREEKSSKYKLRVKASDKRITYLQNKIKQSNDTMAINVDDGLHNGLVEIMNSHTIEIEKKYQKNSFHHLFWNQQVANLLKFPTQRRWHPMIIRWCR